MKLRQAVLVTIIASVILASISLTNAYSAIPPTRGFAKIVSTAGTITANNATAKLNLVEGSGIDFAVNSLTNQLTISSTGGGNASQWATYPAVDDVDLREFSLVSNQPNSASVDKTLLSFEAYYNDDTSGAEYAGTDIQLLGDGLPRNMMEFDFTDNSGITSDFTLNGATHGVMHEMVHIDGDLLNTTLNTNLQLQNTDPTLEFYDAGSNTNGDPVGVINFKGKNDNGDVVNYARINTEIADPTAGAEAGIVHFQVQDTNGALTDFWTLDGSATLQIVYRCTGAGVLPIGALTTNSTQCLTNADTGLRVN